MGTQPSSFVYELWLHFQDQSRELSSYSRCCVAYKAKYLLFDPLQKNFAAHALSHLEYIWKL